MRRDLRCIFGDGIAFSAMVGTGEAYIPAFALALGAAEIWAGLVATLPLALGSLLQVVTPSMVRRLGSRRRWVVACVLVQALAFLPLVAGGIAGRLPILVLYAIVTVYWGAGMASGPAWNTWIERLIPRNVRIGFLASRSRASQIAALAGLVVGGGILAVSASWRRPLYGFAFLFLIALACRLVSGFILMRQSEPRPILGDRIIGLRELLRRAWCGEDGRLLGYLTAIMATVMVAGPFFTPFMLVRLRLGYVPYMSLLAASFVSKAVALPLLARTARRWGPRRLLLLGGLGIFPQPALWLVNQSYPYLLSLQLISGIAWGAHELAAMLLFFDALKEEERTSLLTCFNVMNAFATLCGSLLGGVVFALVGEGLLGYKTIFLVSSALRLLVLGLALRIAHRPILTARTLIRMIGFRPAYGSVGRPLLASLFVGTRGKQPDGSRSRNADEDAAIGSGRVRPRRADPARQEDGSHPR